MALFTCVDAGLFLESAFAFAVIRLRYPERSADIAMAVDVELPLPPASDCLPRSRRTIRISAKTFVAAGEDLPPPCRSDRLCCTGRCPGVCLPHKRLVGLVVFLQKFRLLLGMRICLELSLHVTTGL